MQWKTDGPRSIPQAFPYQGSKRALVGQILSLFPTEQVPLLVEPFAGSAAISVAARMYGRAQDIQISDVNAPLMDLWRMIIDSPDDLLDSYTKMWHEQQQGENSLVEAKAYFMLKRREFNDTKDPAILLYLLARCVKAAVRYGKNGDFNQSADNRRMGARPANMQERIHGASRLMQGAKVTSGSYEDPLVNAPREAIVYMDPPYQGTTDVPDHRYLTGLRRDVFSETLQRAVDNQVSFIVSYDVVREDNKYGEPLADDLGLLHRNVVVGVSSQATLVGRKEMSIESLYISPALVQRLGGQDKIDDLIDVEPKTQDALF
ncbi:DNA adenine methylase [Rhodococcus sp. IEGM 1374]|uniref:DNA adenine methylase n=1 Tax=Rhodococcus sp. IEGM 1374 TaxID=3082221 RepID=UPI002954A3DD|nr:DNA adenine methylase [Rhodococcus sp. IEGM 1374]MDV7992077.1 DNA adenine methylase [Rhodococcus sp. IEGM 1374]